MEYTKESLQNTWGVVNSKEHAEFIIELAELHGFGFSSKLNGNEIYFRIINNFIWFYESGINDNQPGFKKITIPLPPKAKEWTPEVGDTVMLESEHYKSELSEIKYIGDSVIVYKRGVNEFCELLSECKIIKPKSDQDLKIEELQTKLCNLSAVDNYILASEIVMGNVEGLSYE